MAWCRIGSSIAAVSTASPASASSQLPNARFEVRIIEPCGLAEAIRYASPVGRPAATSSRRRPYRASTATPGGGAIRPVALRRKTPRVAALAGPPSARSSTTAFNDVELYAYLRNVLERMTDGHHMRRLDELLPCELAA
jgi:hypothetical protein